MKDSTIQAVILDLDGVITRTAAVHARAWKRMFDNYLAKRGQQASEDHQPFRIDDDYFEHVDGKPGYGAARHLSVDPQHAMVLEYAVRWVMEALGLRALTP